MKDMKKNILGLLISLVGLGVYNLCVFLLASDYTNVFWVSYIFTTLAFIAQIVVDFIFNKSDTNAKFLSLPLFYVGSIYFVVQLFVGIICMVVPASIKVAIIAQALILGAYITVALSSTIAKSHVEETETYIEKTTEAIRALTSEAEYLYASEENGEKKAELKKLYEAIRYSDPMSSTEEICTLDEKINMAFRTVSDMVSAGTVDDLRREVKITLDIIAKRNILCRSSK